MGRIFDDRGRRDERERDYRTPPSRGYFDGTFESRLALARVKIQQEEDENEDIEYEEE